jgi:anthranilate phosphoribosyltransferase
MNLNDTVERVTEGTDLTVEEAREAARLVFEEATEAQIGALLAALRTKGETEAEIAGFARGMRDAARTIEPDREPLVDTCGTGGDDYDTINVSTTAAIVAAGAGVPVAKHGNYSVSSSSGSADVLEVAGADVEAEPPAVEAAIEEDGIGFMLAPVFHPAMKAVIGPRKELGMRTIFNVLGPLTNPAGADAQVLGVYDPDLVPVIARSLAHMPVERALVVHGAGMDEIGIIVAGEGHDGTAYVVDDRSVPGSVGPNRWGKAVRDAYDDWRADCVVVESNYGGDLVVSNVQGVSDRHVNVEEVTATRGKAVRAEPVAGLYGDETEEWEDAQVRHAGTFTDLEAQMTSWVPSDSDSPDRLDALVWAMHELALSSSSSAQTINWDRMEKEDIRL